MAKVSKRTWLYCKEHGSTKACREHDCRAGRKRTAYGFTLYVDGKRVRRQFETRAEADTELDKFKEDLKKPRPVAVPTLTLDAALDRLLKEKSRKRALREYEWIAEHLKTEFGKDTPLTALTADRISAYKAQRLGAVRTIGKGEKATERRLSPAAINRPLAVLRHLLRLAHEEWGVLAAAPRIRTEKEPQGRLRWLTESEAIRLLEACRKSQNKALADLAEFALFTGVRKSEALGLTWDRVERARGVIRLEITKSGHRREVPLSANADAVLARRAGSDEPTGYVFGSANWYTFQTAWRAAVRRAKLANFRFHDLRHTFASWLVQRGRTLKEVQEALGHQTIAMTMRYAHLAPDHLRAAVASLDDVLSIPRAQDGRKDIAPSTVAQAVVAN